MLEELKQQVWQANIDLANSGLVPLTWGNASGIDRPSGLVVIKPSGVSYDRLQPSDMVVVGLDGKVVDSPLQPSSDTPAHLEVYRAWTAIGGITHTHSVHATMFAQACRPLPCLGTTHADHFYGEVPVTRLLTAEEVRADYETATGSVIVERFADLDPVVMPAVLVACHGPFTWGANAAAAVANAIALEEVSRMALGTLQLNPSIPPLAQYILDKHYHRKHGADAYYGQRTSDEN